MRRAALALCLLAHEAAAASDALTRVDGVLATLMARMRAPEPSDRPNFTEALADLARRRLRKQEWHGECGGAANGSLVAFTMAPQLRSASPAPTSAPSSGV